MFKRRAIIAPVADPPVGWFRSTAPIPENRHGVYEDFAGVTHVIHWCVSHDNNLHPGADSCHLGHEWGEDCQVVEAHLQLVGEPRLSKWGGGNA